MDVPRGYHKVISLTFGPLALLAVTACREPAALGPVPAFAERNDPGVAAGHSPAPAPVPFRGTLVATRQVPDQNPPPPCEMRIWTTLAGELTHLGRFSGSGSTCAFNGQFGVVDPPSNPAGGAPPYFVTDFQVQQSYTAASGDVLDVSGVGVLVQSLADGSAGLTGVGTVEGGTGRFEGATGQFEVFGVNGRVSYDGWIRFDASNRSNRDH